MAQLTPEDGTGLTDANAMCDVAWADDYLSSQRLHASDWAAELDSDVKAAALIWAWESIERELACFWRGWPKTTTQALAFPRFGLVDRRGQPIASTVVPTAAKQANAELALQLYREDRQATADAGGVTSLSMGNSSISYGGGGSSRVVPGGVRNILADLIDVRIRVVRA